MSLYAQVFQDILVCDNSEVLDNIDRFVQVNQSGLDPLRKDARVNFETPFDFPIVFRFYESLRLMIHSPFLPAPPASPAQLNAPSYLIGVAPRRITGTGRQIGTGVKSESYLIWVPLWLNSCKLSTYNH